MQDQSSGCGQLSVRVRSRCRVESRKQATPGRTVCGAEAASRRLQTGWQTPTVTTVREGQATPYSSTTSEVAALRYEAPSVACAKVNKRSAPEATTRINKANRWRQIRRQRAAPNLEGRRCLQGSPDCHTVVATLAKKEEKLSENGAASAYYYSGK